MYTQDWLTKTQKNSYGNRPHAYCKDGLKLSIQASKYHYCEPRMSEAAQYLSVEIGYPSRPLRALKAYAAGTNLTDTVYAYVPITELDRVLKRHGGIVA